MDKIEDFNAEKKILPQRRKAAKDRSIRLPFELVHRLLALLLISACAGVPVRGNVGGQSVDTRVDSEAARYYVAGYLAGQRSNPLLDGRIAGIYNDAHHELPDRAELRRLSEEFSIDFAAAYFAERIANTGRNRQFRESYLNYRRAFTQNRLQLPASVAECEVMFVPSYLYKRLPITGTDFALPRKALQKVGLPVHFVETVEDGAVEANADTVAAAIAARASSGRRLILVSASKSAPEVALALTRLGAARTKHVAGWINAVGTLQGTPLADERAMPQIEQLVGAVDKAGMESLTTERSRRRFQSFRVPAHVSVVNYFGIPFSGSVSSWGSPGFGALAKHGPNDGILLLTDMIFPGGLTVAELGLDHFLLDRDIGAATVGLVAALVEWIEQQSPQLLPVSVK